MKYRLLAALALWIPPAGAMEVVGVELPDRWPLDDKTLVLNGAGVREYGALGVDVYVAALYLPAKQGAVSAVLDSVGPKLLHMVFFRDVTQEDTVKAWEYYLKANCQAPCVLPNKQLEQFYRLVPATEEDDSQTYLFREDTVQILVNGKPVGQVKGGGFARLLLATWIGEVPTTKALKRALLGPAR